MYFVFKQKNPKPFLDFGIPKKSTFFFFFFFGCPTACGSSPATGQVRAAVATYTAAGAMLDPLTRRSRPGIEPASWFCRDAVNPAAPQGDLYQHPLLYTLGKQDVPVTCLTVVFVLWRWSGIEPMIFLSHMESKRLQTCFWS